jgi:hypothetical protein
MAESRSKYSLRANRKPVSYANDENQERYRQPSIAYRNRPKNEKNAKREQMVADEESEDSDQNSKEIQYGFAETSHKSESEVEEDVKSFVYNSDEFVGVPNAAERARGGDGDPSDEEIEIEDIKQHRFDCDGRLEYYCFSTEQFNLSWYKEKVLLNDSTSRKMVENYKEKNSLDNIETYQSESDEEPISHRKREIKADRKKKRVPKPSRATGARRSTRAEM